MIEIMQSADKALRTNFFKSYKQVQRCQNMGGKSNEIPVIFDYCDYSTTYQKCPG